MDKESLISTLQSSPNLDILSERTFDEVTTAALPLFDFNEESTVTAFLVQVFKTMAGQIRHDVSVNYQRALEIHNNKNNITKK